MSGEVRFVRIRGRIIPIRQKKPTMGERVGVGAYGAANGAAAGYAAGQLFSLHKTKKGMVRAQGLLRKGFEINKRGLSPAFAKRFANAMPLRPSSLPVVHKATPILDDAMKLASGTILKRRFDRTMSAIHGIQFGARGRMARAGKIGAVIGAAAYGALYATRIAQEFSDVRQGYKKKKMTWRPTDFPIVSKTRR